MNLYKISRSINEKYLHLLYIYPQNIGYYLNTYSFAFKTFFENICLVLSVGLKAQNEWCLQADTLKICELEMYLKCESGSSVDISILFYIVSPKTLVKCLPLFRKHSV